MQPIDRDGLVKAIDDAMDDLEDAGIDDDTNATVGMRLIFLITGEDGTKLSDSDLLRLAEYEDGLLGYSGALTGMLLVDLEGLHQGFPDEQSWKDAWETCQTIASAYCNFIRERKV